MISRTLSRPPRAHVCSPTGQERPPGLWRVVAVGSETAHSYQTFVLSCRRHQWLTICSPFRTKTGTCRGKYIGNQLNMPSEKVLGSMDMRALP